MADHHTTHGAELELALNQYESLQAKYAAAVSGVEYGGTWTARRISSDSCSFNQQTPLQFINEMALNRFAVSRLNGDYRYKVTLYGERTENTENPANPWTVSIKIDGIELVRVSILSANFDDREFEFNIVCDHDDLDYGLDELSSAEAQVNVFCT